jgi:hypothetical protein
MKTFEGGVEPFVISGKAAEPCRPGEAAFDDPTAWQQHEASFCHGMLDHFEPQAMLSGGFGSVGASVTLVYIGPVRSCRWSPAAPLRPACHLFAITLISRRDGQRQQAPECVDRDVDLRSLTPLGSVIARPRSRFRRRLQGAAVDHDRRGLALAPAPLAQQPTARPRPASRNNPP